MAQHVLAIDQGTTGTTVSIMNAQGVVLAKENQEFPQIFPQPGWVEHDPDEIWKSTTETIQRVLSGSGVAAADLAGIGITNQRETVVLWDRNSGKPVYNAIVWQCRRTADFCDILKKDKGKVRTLKAKTGLVVDPYFSASKVRWILKNVGAAKQKAESQELIMGTMDTYLLWKLTGGEVHATDVTNASRTQLMDINSLQWDQELLDMFSVPDSVLPEIRPSSGVFGVTQGCQVLPDGIPIAGIAGDQQAALFGQACFAEGEAKCTFGTGSFLLMNTGAKKVTSKTGNLTTVAWQLQGEPPVYALEGGAFICGAAVQWLRDGLEILQDSSQVEALASSVADCGGVVFVPALTGLGAPYWDPHARGMISGLTRGTTRAHLARATLEGMALQNAEILWAMEKDAKKRLKSLKVDGGAAANNLLMQMQADFLSTKVVRPQVIETTAAGAAFLAGLAVGLWRDTGQIRQIWKQEKVFVGEMPSKQRKLRVDSWQRAIGRARL